MPQRRSRLGAMMAVVAACVISLHPAAAASAASETPSVHRTRVPITNNSLWGVQPIHQQAAIEVSQSCQTSGSRPAPEEVAVDRVPIVVPSTEREYFVLYVLHDTANDESGQPVSVALGKRGQTELFENVPPLPADRYRVEKYSVDEPADVDGDCVDDLTELAQSESMNPVNPAPVVSADDGAITIANNQVFDELAYDGLLKFVMFDLDSDLPGVYFINTNTHKTHGTFLKAAGLEPSEIVKGHIAFDAERVTTAGSVGAFHFGLATSFTFGDVERAHALLSASMPLLGDDLALYVWDLVREHVEHERSRYENSRINLVFDDDLNFACRYGALNAGVGYGILRIMELEQRPNPRDVVIYDVLPNELPHVSGIITTVPQTPLAHVNLRAIQDGAPNSYIRDILDDPLVNALIGQYVRYQASEAGWDIRPATVDDVNAHYEAFQSVQSGPLQRDLSVTRIRPLSQIGFDDWKSVGVKAANVAAMGRMGLADGVVPDGFAIPFSFYDAFMRAMGLQERVERLLKDPQFRSDYLVQQRELESLRDAMRDANAPEWINQALNEMHASYPAGTSLRYRSSTNNEDLPGFSGAGLYTSKTQQPDEEPIAKSMKQVFASLWSFRAFTEREFHGIDHTKTAMGILVHPNFEGELVNGVAVSYDPINSRDDYYYINSQIGEDLVTNPDQRSLPEEILVARDGDGVAVLRTSNRLAPGQSVLDTGHRDQLREYLSFLHDGFARLYDVAPGQQFAIEVEFKVTRDNRLAIKQARPWVFSMSLEEFSDVDDVETTPSRGEATVVRLSGFDRYGTSLAAARAVAMEANGRLTRIVLMSGTDWPDALTAAALAGGDEGAVLMVPPKGLASEALQALVTWGVSEAVVVGGEAALASSALVAIQDLGIEVQRISGADRYLTAVAVANELGTPAELEDRGRSVIIASGENYADALVAGPLAAHSAIPVLLTPSRQLHPAVRTFLSTRDVQHAVLMGGSAALSEDVEEAVQALGIEVTRIGGASRYETAQEMAKFMADALRGECGDANEAGLAPGTQPFDALTAGPLLGRLCAPLLLTAAAELPAAARSQLRVLHWAGNLRLHVFGGPYSILRAVVTRAVDPY